MSDQHDKIQEELIDIWYGEKQMTEEIKTHLESCSNCAMFWSELDVVKSNLISDEDIEVDERIIGRAFSEAAKEQQRNVNITSLISFIMVAGAILAVIGLLVYAGYGLGVMVIQGMFMFGVPFMIPIILRQRLAKEGK